MNANEPTYILARHVHRIEKRELLDVVMIKEQSGGYLGEDNIVRFEGHRGRA